MPLSNSVIRRYTPPTCTLEVLAQSSPLSRWMGKSVIKQVRFNLSFDDPRQPEKEKVVVQGDRDQLEALYTAVSSYVQEILQQSPENFWASRVKADSVNNSSETRAVADVPNSEPDISSFRNEFASRGNGNIYLQPRSHLTHELFLGSLASQVGNSSIQLSLLQLFDLATALDEYTTDVVAMPSVSQRRRNNLEIPGWAPVAAVLVLGLGLMPFTYQYANRLREQKQTGETVATANQEIGNDVSPTLLPTPNSVLTPLPNASPLPTLGSGLTVPNASLPSLTSPNPTLGTIPGSTLPPASTNPNSSLSNIPLLPDSSNLGGSTAIKPQTGGQTLSFNSNSPTAKTQGGNNSTLISPGNTNLPSTTRPLTSLPPLTNPSTPIIPVPPSKQSPASLQNNNQPSSLTNTAKLDSDLAAQLRDTRTAIPAKNEQKSTTTAAANSETLFDTNQVAEVRSYFKQRWQPPKGLTEPLQYSLTVGVDGALEQILPLGKAARDHVEKAGIPEIGQPFVSPSRNGQNVRVRAIFRPDGQVQAIPETD
ncbi:MAG: DUF4335 domain-containing protein [Richelia sp. SL_2_1]|nr:DUF4335 domain-containing protein [Richelia sp. SM1_7_0]NJO28015.1 DUF4335 domain-containing protein [Richelia sp. SL_2_1]